MRNIKELAKTEDFTNVSSISVRFAFLNINGATWNDTNGKDTQHCWPAAMLGLKKVRFVQHTSNKRLRHHLVAIVKFLMPAYCYQGNNISIDLIGYRI